MRTSDWSSAVCSSDLRRAKVAALLMNQCGTAALRTLRNGHGRCHRDGRSTAGDPGWLRQKPDLDHVPLDHTPNGGEQRRHVAPAHSSEAHTSELQSLMRISYAVFCLEQKNKRTN